MIFDNEANKIIDILNNNGFDAYYVGGCVRDSLLGIVPHDFDINTNAKPEYTKKLLIDAGFKVVETGIKHGTVIAIINKKQFEITTFRSDGEYKDGRHPENVIFVNSLKEDLARRDFTVNAMAYHPKSGLVDFFGGRHDLDNKIIRCVGEPVKRFEEDALRILRALRFAGRFGFTIEENTSKAVKDCCLLLNKVSAERIYSELCGILVTNSVASIIREYIDVFGLIIPELLPLVNFEQKSKWHIYDAFEHTMVALENAPPDLIVRLTMLFHDLGKPAVCVEDERGFRHFKGHQKVSCDTAKRILLRLKADNKTIERVCKLVLHHDDRIPPDEAAVLRLMRRMGDDVFRIIQVERADHFAQNQEMVAYRFNELFKIEEIVNRLIKDECACIHVADLDISGDDLIECGVPKGPRVGETLNFLLNEVIEKRLPNNREALVSFVKSIV